MASLSLDVEDLSQMQDLTLYALQQFVICGIHHIDFLHDHHLSSSVSELQGRQGLVDAILCKADGGDQEGFGLSTD